MFLAKKSFILIVILIILSLIGCSGASSQDVDYSVYQKPFDDAGNQTFTMSDELNDLLTNPTQPGAVWNFFQLNEDSLLFNSSGDSSTYYLYSIGNSQLEHFTFTDNNGYNVFLLEVNPKNETFIYFKGGSLFLSDFSGNIIKQIDDVIQDIGFDGLVFQQDDYIILGNTKTVEGVGKPYTSIYDSELNLVKEYEGMKLVYTHTGSVILSSNTTYVSDQFFNQRICGYDQDKGEFYVFSNGKLNLLVSGISGKLDFASFRYGVYLLKTDENVYIYQKKLISLGDPDSLKEFYFTNYKGDIEVKVSNSEYELYRSDSDKLITVNTANQPLYFTGDSYVIQASANTYIENSLDRTNVETFMLPVDNYFTLEVNPVNLGGQIFLTGDVTVDEGTSQTTEIDAFRLSDTGVEAINNYYYDGYNNTLAVISQDMSRITYFQDNKAFAFSDDPDIIGSTTAQLINNFGKIVNDEIVKVNSRADIEFYDYDGNLLSKDIILAYSSNTRFIYLQNSYANTLVLTDSDNKQAKLISLPI